MDQTSSSDPVSETGRPVSIGPDNSTGPDTLGPRPNPVGTNASATNPVGSTHDAGNSVASTRDGGSAHGHADVKAPCKVVLSTTSVYPEKTGSGFELAASLGYDGVELMVGIDPVASDIDYMVSLRDYHQIPVHAVHAPCLLVSQTTWGNDPWHKLERSAEAAERLGADVVVVHPPFRWQREYARGFVEGIRHLNETTGVCFAVENMYPWRSPTGGSFQAYLPAWDPTDLPYEHLVLDLSHASTSQRQSLDYVRAWGDRLRHVHLTDGSGSMKDEHLLPGQGDQHAFEVLHELARRGFTGHVVLEVNTRRQASRAEREEALAQSLHDTRRHLGQLG